ncbi:MAG: (d)CMP kinase [Salibacteraceae bacterium]
MNRINIAIDGFSGCGKSTLARDLAKALQYKLVDTGAMFRAVTWFVLKENVSAGDFLHTQPVIDVDPASGGVVLNGQLLVDELRSPEVAQLVSDVAAQPTVRSYLLDIQQRLAEHKGVIMEGRDIGTVVLPFAELKLFITARLDERVNRRYLQLLEMGIETSRQQVEENLKERDFKDTTRKIAPLSKAADAIAIDTSNFTRDEQLKVALSLAHPLIHPDELLPGLS